MNKAQTTFWKKIKCFFGFHDFEAKKVYGFCIIDGFMNIDVLKCKKCGKEKENG